VFPKRFLLADPFWLRKITTDPHILAHVNRVSGWPVSKIKNVRLVTDLDKKIHASSTRNNALHDLTLIKLTAARFVDTGVSQLDTLTKIRNKYMANYRSRAIIFNKTLYL
jgi:hypothetical protein